MTLIGLNISLKSYLDFISTFGSFVLVYLTANHVSQVSGYSCITRGNYFVSSAYNIEYCVINKDSTTSYMAVYPDNICSTIGYSPAVIDTPGKQAYLWMNRNWLMGNILASRRCYIGLFCLSGPLQWFDGTPYNAVTTYTYFSTSPAPSSCSYMCTYIDGSTDTMWTMLDYNTCTSTYYSVLCQRANNVTMPSPYTCATKKNSTFPDHVTEYCAINTDPTLTWSQAQSACTMLGYTMAVVNSASEQAYMAANAASIVGSGSNGQYWLGMSAANSTACSSSSYTWLDGTSVNTFYWNVTGGPSCTGTPNPLGPFICGYGKRNSGPSNWFATDCTTTMNALCERSWTVPTTIAPPTTAGRATTVVSTVPPPTTVDTTTPRLTTVITTTPGTTTLATTTPLLTTIESTVPTVTTQPTTKQAATTVATTLQAFTSLFTTLAAAATTVVTTQQSATSQPTTTDSALSTTTTSVAITSQVIGILSTQAALPQTTMSLSPTSSNATAAANATQQQTATVAINSNSMSSTSAKPSLLSTLAQALTAVPASTITGQQVTVSKGSVSLTSTKDGSALTSYSHFPIATNTLTTGSLEQVSDVTGGQLQGVTYSGAGVSGFRPVVTTVSPNNFVPLSLVNFVLPGSVPCPDVGLANSIVVSYRETMYMAMLTLVCDTNYRFTDGAQSHVLTCRFATATWTSNSPRCIALTCPSLLIVSNSIASANETIINTVITYTCLTGYHFPDGTRERTIICLTNQTWSATIDDCIPVSCAAIGLVAASRYHALVTSYCPADEFYSNGLDHQTTACTSVGVWAPWPEVTCYGPSCGPLVYVSYGLADDTIGTLVNDTVTITCIPGYHLDDGVIEQQVTCLDVLQYSDTRNCLAITCDQSPLLSHATRSTSSAIYDTVVVYECERGYRFSDNTTRQSIVCLQTGLWNSSVDDCQPIICPQLPIITMTTNNGSQLASSRSAGWHFDEIVQYTCTFGSLFPDGRSTSLMTCGPDSTWTNSNVDCSYNRCVVQPSYANTVSELVGTTNIGSYALYKCEDGYVFSDGSFVNALQCDDNKQWTGTVPKCAPRPCPKLTIQAHGTWSSLTGSYVSRVQLMCDTGYVLIGGNSSTSIDCLANGTWSNSNTTSLTCNGVMCDTPRRLANATYQQSGDTYQSETVYSCLPGFWFQRDVISTTVTCLASGLWNDTATLGCSEVSCLPFPVWDRVTLVSAPDTSYLSTVNVSCANGYAFNAILPVSVVVTTCDSFGKWQPQPRSCIATTASVNTVPVVPVEAHNGATLGLVAICFCVSLLVVIILIDIVPMLLASSSSHLTTYVIRRHII